MDFIMNTIFFNQIKLTPPIDKIYRRLGYSQGKTRLTASEKKKMAGYIDEAVDLIHLKGVAVRIPVANITSAKIVLKGDITFNSQALAKFLTGSDEILLMGATAGSKIMNAIRSNSAGRDITRAVVFDATASEIVDGSLSWIMNYINRQLRRESKQLTRQRFSAGYGDLALSNQKIICQLLKMKKIGVTLTRNYIMVPEKSVTALAGIKQI